MNSLVIKRLNASCISNALKLSHKCVKRSYLTYRKPLEIILKQPRRFNKSKTFLHRIRKQCLASLTSLAGERLNSNSLFYININSDEKNQDDVVMTTVSNLNSSCDILDYINSIDLNELTPDHVNLALYCVMRLHYNDLCQQHGWLQSNIHIAFIQMSLGKDIGEFMDPITTRPGYKKLIKASHLYHESMEVNKVISTLISLIYLGLPKYDPLIYFYLTRFYKRTDEVPLQQWLLASQVFKCLNSYSDSMIHKACESLKKFTVNKFGCSLDELYIASYLGINVYKVMKTETSMNIIKWLQKELATANLIERPKYLSTYLRFLKNLSHNQFHLKDEVADSVGSVLKACKHVVNTLESSDIADICRSLKVMHLYNDDELIETIGKRINNLVKDTTSLVDLSNLMYGLTKISPNFLIRKFENYLYSKISLENVNIDVITLSNIADSLFELPKINKDIIILIQNLIALNSDPIIEYITRFNKISKLLIKYPFIEPENEKLFTEKVIKYLDEKPVISSYSITYMGRYLLSLPNYDCIPNHIFLTLLKSLPKWNVGELCKLYANINNSSLSCSKEQRQRYLQVLGDVQQLIIEKLRDVDNITQIDSIALAMVIHTKFRNSLVTKHVEETFMKFGEDLNALRVAKASKLMRQTNFHIPAVFEKFVDFIISNKGEAVEKCSLNVLRSVAFNGYRPIKVNKFFQFIKGIYERQYFEKDFYKCLSMLNDLATLQFFPEDLLVQFFKIDTMHDLEKFMEENTDLGMKTQTMLMQVNRCIAIECPHLDIPWFHEQFCKENLVKKDFQNMNVKNLLNEVNNVLEHVLNGHMFIKRNSYSPFYHKFDFECALDNMQKPIPMSVLDDGFDAPLQRYAICVLPESSYCKNDKVLNGKECVRKRHLKLLGYKYVEIPFFEWYSMGLTEKLTKKKYLEEKLFSN